MTPEEKRKLKRCACLNVRGASRILTQFYEDKFQDSTLKATQFQVLAGISYAGKITVSQLADLLLMDQTTLTRNFQLLQKQGLAESIPGEDQRTRYLIVTEKGEEAIEQAMPFWEQAQDKIIETLGEERYRAFLKELSNVVAIAKS